MGKLELEMHSSKLISLAFFSYRSLDERTHYKKGMSVVSAIHNSQSGQCAESLFESKIGHGWTESSAAHTQMDYARKKINSK